jgi:hypothetical protein
MLELQDGRTITERAHTPVDTLNDYSDDADARVGGDSTHAAEDDEPRYLVIGRIGEKHWSAVIT